MKKKHRDNLLKLADYLEALPADCKEFDMRVYNSVKADTLSGTRSLGPDTRQHGCGTAACALGHGPAAGIRVYGDGCWGDYCKRVFGIDCDSRRNIDKFEYLFAATWVLFDNTPHGAAARIRTYVELGGKTPDGWKEERDGMTNGQL
jgi:hypothetical protein